MSFAPRDSHEAQVQFALERGIPAIIGVLGTVKLPYPSRAFDMAHCSRCLINWSKNGKKIEEMLFICSVLFSRLYVTDVKLTMHVILFLCLLFAKDLNLSFRWSLYDGS